MKTINSYLITCLYRNQVTDILVEMNRFEFSFDYEFRGKFRTDEFRIALDAMIEAEAKQPRNKVELTGCYLLHSDTFVTTSL